METAVVTGEQDVELSCTPWVEASVFTETHGSTAYADLKRVHCPTWP